MLFETLSTARDLGRLQDIGSVLVRHGLGDLVRRLGIAGLLERAGRALHWSGPQGLSKDPAVHVREALEELGPAFVKLGQLLAGRSDLLPPAWTEELSKLHERARPAPSDEVLEQLRADLGAEPGEVFEDFEEEPLAAASIAQVHRASLPDGTRVVLKVRRPDIRRTVEADLRLLARLADLAEERLPELRNFRPRSLIRQFKRSLENELDLRVEARNAERLRANLPPDGGIVIPAIHEEWTRESLCVMDFLEGPSIGQWLRDGMPGGPPPARLAARGADAVLKMVFTDGCFHADPHPGNVLVLRGGRIGLVDFGMVGLLSERRRLEFLDLLAAVATRRVEDVVGILLDWADGEAEPDLLAQDCTAFLDRYYGVSLRRLDVSAVLADLTGLLRENGLFLPNDVALLLKVFVTLEGLGRLIDPDFVMAAHVEPFVRSALREQRSPSAVARRGAGALSAFVTSLPRHLGRLGARLRRGKIDVAVEVQRLDDFARKLDRSANRLTMGIVTASLIIGTSIALTVPGGPQLLGLPAFGLLGFASSLAAGFWVLWSILRSGGRR